MIYYIVSLRLYHIYFYCIPIYFGFHILYIHDYRNPNYFIENDQIVNLKNLELNIIYLLIINNLIFFFFVYNILCHV